MSTESTGSSSEAEPPAPTFPPIPATADPQRPAPADDPLQPDVPAYPAEEPMPDPAPDWLTP